MVRQDAPVPEEKLETLLRRELRMRGLFIDDPDVLRADGRRRGRAVGAAGRRR